MCFDGEKNIEGASVHRYVMEGVVVVSYRIDYDMVVVVREGETDLHPKNDDWAQRQHSGDEESLMASGDEYAG